MLMAAKMVKATKSVVIALAVAVGFCAAAAGQSVNPPSIEIVSPWARASAGAARDGVVYLTIVNKGATDDGLVSVSTPVARKTELHETVTESGVTKMRSVPAVEVKAGGKAVLKPGGYMIMLFDLANPLKVGQTFPMTLAFEKAGEVAVAVKVEKPGAAGPADMKGMKMD